ncbi:MAG TPA: DUF1080 domain-containing protein [Acidobacteriota bacterium]|nr:DUF1080 domain-containing protein [Acidobacteriota bacterium]
MAATNTCKCRLGVSRALVGLLLLSWTGLSAVTLQQKPAEKQEWRSLFDGKTLTNWKSTNFGGEGEVKVQNGKIIIGMGATLSGITWVGGEIPHMNYEISLEAMKTSGNDFFCGLTFPVGNSPCSLIVGGWGGSVVGLSSIDGMDASENETSTVGDFAQNRWYRIRLRVTPRKIEALIDDKSVVDVVTTGRQISIRPEVLLSQPLGIATWITEAALRDIKIRMVD